MWHGERFVWSRWEVRIWEREGALYLSGVSAADTGRHLSFSSVITWICLTAIHACATRLSVWFGCVKIPLFLKPWGCSRCVVGLWLTAADLDHRSFNPIQAPAHSIVKLFGSVFVVPGDLPTEGRAEQGDGVPDAPQQHPWSGGHVHTGGAAWSCHHAQPLSALSERQHLCKALS